MLSMVVVVINESLDSAVERGPVFLWLCVNILVFYRFPKSFNPNVVFSPAAAVHVDTQINWISQVHLKAIWAVHFNCSNY